MSVFTFKKGLTANKETSILLRKCDHFSNNYLEPSSIIVSQEIFIEQFLSMTYDVSIYS